ncbi:putative BPI/LBP family protein At1g04970 [Ziziphus jujuba]|uniref:BPI/LBP family protein At1g04970 n=1 Tax=Ziziphus jujuba TaxID=326968 RepID=A0A6P4ARG1_ZIZJJ|nr:putative BPI/LBP family protein At1g04970 [Ziziphus jujuba]
MGYFSKLMKSTILLLFLSLVLVPASTDEEGFISVLISNKGLDFVKDVLIKSAISSIIPLQLPLIEKPVKIPVIGTVHLHLSNVTIYSVDITSSYVETGDTGIVLVASGATAHLSMNWSYHYHALVIDISDHGTAAVEVEGMQVGVTVALEDQEGTLKLNILDSGCHVKDISVKLDGGASWLYQVFVDAFGGTIRSAVEDNIMKKIREGMMKLDSLLQSLPKKIAVNDIVAMNVTFTGNPILSNSSVELEINGLFLATDDLVSKLHLKASSALVYCTKMVEMSLHENVFNSLSAVLFDAGYMQWIVDEVPDYPSILNTFKWRFIVPELYRQYPNDNMDLHITVTSPPIIKVVNNDIDVTIYLDVTVEVLDAPGVIPVLSISLEISASCSLDIMRKKLVGSLELKHFNADLNWSTIGTLHMHLIESLMAVVLKTIAIPYANLQLRNGIPLPLLHGFTLRNADIFCTDSMVIVCSNVAYAAELNSLSRHFALSR